MAYTLRELSELCNVSKQAIRKKIKKLQLEQELNTDGNTITVSETASEAILCYYKVSTKRQPNANQIPTDNQPNANQIIETPANKAEALFSVDTNQTPTDNQNANQIIDILNERIAELKADKERLQKEKDEALQTIKEKEQTIASLTASKDRLYSQITRYFLPATETETPIETTASEVQTETETASEREQTEQPAKKKKRFLWW